MCVCVCVQGNDMLSKLGVVCCYIWKARNERVFQNSPIVAPLVALQAESLWKEVSNPLNQTC